MAECAQARSCVEVEKNGSGILNHISLKFITGPCLGWGLPWQSVPKPELGKSYSKLGTSNSGIPTHIFLKCSAGPCLGWGLPWQNAPEQEIGKVA